MLLLSRSSNTALTCQCEKCFGEGVCLEEHQILRHPPTPRNCFSKNKVFIVLPCRSILKPGSRIPDPTATKPDDWDEDAPPKIPDADAVKPDGWLDNGPEFIPDPDAEMPDDW